MNFVVLAGMCSAIIYGIYKFLFVKSQNNDINPNQPKETQKLVTSDMQNPNATSTIINSTKQGPFESSFVESNISDHAADKIQANSTKTDFFSAVDDPHSSKAVLHDKLPNEGSIEDAQNSKLLATSDEKLIDNFHAEQHVNNEESSMSVQNKQGGDNDYERKVFLDGEDTENLLATGDPEKIQQEIDDIEAEEAELKKQLDEVEQQIQEEAHVWESEKKKNEFAQKVEAEKDKRLKSIEELERKKKDRKKSLRISMAKGSLTR